MRSRNTNVRSKVVALLLSLVALWGFAAYVTVRDGLNLLWVSVTFEDIGTPLDNVVTALADERALAVKASAGDRSAAQALGAARAVTDEKVNALWASADSTAVDWAASGTTKQYLSALHGQLDTLGEVRNRLDARSSDILQTIEPYNAIIDSAFLINRSLASFDDKNIAAQSRAVVNVVYAHEIVRREDALMSGVFAAGTMTGPERAEFGNYVGMRRFLHTEELTDLVGAARTELSSMQNSQPYQQLQSIESSVIASGSGAGVTSDSWRKAMDEMSDPLQKFESTAVDTTLASAESAAIGTIVRLVLAGLLGLAAVVASIIISITTARKLVRQLERLRNAARDLASYRLPRVVERLQHGEQVDVAQEAPALEFGRDEIGQVGEAFNQVQETAIRVAVEQAELRRSVRDVFLSLARRSQALLHRQLGLLDAMERRATDSEELAGLFRIDHLATRMRRNAENLIVLSGATAGRAWRKQVPMVDVLRGALAEVEDYTRVTVLPVGNASLLGRAVGDVIHLLAELIENAVSFSPPQTTVRVGGSLVGYGFAIEIEDRGLGMSPEELAAANEQLRDPPEFRLTSTARLGLYVVGRLAERHGIRVRLTESPYGGTTAIVLLPGSIMADDATEDPLDPSQLDSYRPAQLAGVGRHRLQGAEPDRRQADGAVAMLEPGEGLAAGTGLNGADREPSILPPPQNGYAQPTAFAPAAVPPAPAPAAPTATAAPTAPTITPATAEPPQLTPGGLPLRQRRPATEEPPTVAPAAITTPTGPFGTVQSDGQPPAAAPTPRNPDATRSLMASYRSGTLRGRSDAARLTGEEGAAPPAPEPDATATPGPDQQPPPWPPDAPQWTQTTPLPPQWDVSPESPQWTKSTPEMRETEEGG